MTYVPKRAGQGIRRWTMGLTLGFLVGCGQGTEPEPADGQAALASTLSARRPSRAPAHVSSPATEADGGRTGPTLERRTPSPGSLRPPPLPWWQNAEGRDGDSWPDRRCQQGPPGGGTAPSLSEVPNDSTPENRP